MKGEKQFTLEEDDLIRQRATGKLGVPAIMRPDVLREAHDSPVGGHFGAQQTTALVQRKFYRKGLAQDVKRYVRGRAACHRAKPSNKKPFGLLMPLGVPRRRCERINVDFMTKLSMTTPGELPTYGGKNTIITFIDALRKRTHWVAACEKTLTAVRFASIFLDSFFRVAWPTRCHRLKPGRPVHRRFLATPKKALGNADEDVNRFPPPNGRTEEEGEQHNGKAPADVHHRKRTSLG